MGHISRMLLITHHLRVMLVAKVRVGGPSRSSTSTSASFTGASGSAGCFSLGSASGLEPPHPIDEQRRQPSTSVEVEKRLKQVLLLSEE